MTSVLVAFIKFKNAHARAWKLDTEDECMDKERKATREAWEAAKLAEYDLLALIDSTTK